MSTRIKKWQDGDINRQLSSPLFGLIPVEVRELILELALTETAIRHPHPLAISHDFDIRQGHPPVDDADLEERFHGVRVAHSGEDWLRPGNTGPKVIYCALLRTCRRIYLESAHLPVQHKELTIYGDNIELRGPPWEVRGERVRGLDTVHSESRMARSCATIPYHALSKIHRLHVFGLESNNFSWLGDDFVSSVQSSFHWKKKLLRQSPPPAFRHLRLLDNIRILRLTIRRSDWKWFDDNWPLEMNPYNRYWDWNKDLHNTQTTALIAASATSPLVPTHGSFMNAKFIPSLRTLTIDFETTNDKLAEMERIVRWAVSTWRFLVSPDHYYTDFAAPIQAPTHPDGRPARRVWLTAHAGSVERWSWRGFPYHFARRCPACDRPADSAPAGCEYCLERGRLEKRNLGPRLYVWSVTWTADEYVKREDEEAKRKKGERRRYRPGRRATRPSWRNGRR